MNITIIGGHGKIAMMLHPILKERGHLVRGIIRKTEQAGELREAGAEPVVCDIEIENDLTDVVGNSDAVVFAAGAGPGSGKERKYTVDRDGAVKLIHAAHKAGIDRYIMISAMNLDKPRGDNVFQAYQKAKMEADEALRKSGLDYTILRPGKLTDEPGSGQISLAKELEPGEIPREDVARVIAELLETPGSAGYEFDLTTGNTPIAEAVQKAAG